MDYEAKYYKYKAKYFKLLNKMDGAFDSPKSKNKSIRNSHKIKFSLDVDNLDKKSLGKTTPLNNKMRTKLARVSKPKLSIDFLEHSRDYFSALSYWENVFNTYDLMIQNVKDNKDMVKILSKIKKHYEEKNNYNDYVYNTELLSAINAQLESFDEEKFGGVINTKKGKYEYTSIPVILYVKDEKILNWVFKGNFFENLKKLANKEIIKKLNDLNKKIESIKGLDVISLDVDGMSFEGLEKDYPIGMDIDFFASILNYLLGGKGMVQTTTPDGKLIFYHIIDSIKKIK